MPISVDIIAKSVPYSLIKTYSLLIYAFDHLAIYFLLILAAKRGSYSSELTQEVMVMIEGEGITTKFDVEESVEISSDLAELFESAPPTLPLLFLEVELRCFLTAVGLGWVVVHLLYFDIIIILVY